jgi:hypothetical protein
MGRRSIIYQNRLENYVTDLFINQRKTIKEIAQLIKKKKKIPISSESVRLFTVTLRMNDKTSENTVKHG